MTQEYQGKLKNIIFFQCECIRSNDDWACVSDGLPYPIMSPNYDFDVGFLADTAMSRTPEPPCKRQLSFEYPDNQLGLDVT
jgi:hypothetical protein